MRYYCGKLDEYLEEKKMQRKGCNRIKFGIQGCKQTWQKTTKKDFMCKYLILRR